MSMAEAYATFAARGKHCDPIIISKITSRDGKPLEVPSANCEQVISKPVADGMNRLLSRVMTGNGTGTRTRIPGIAHQAGKTGTINGSKAVWFAGYTSEIAGVSMIAVDPTRKTWRSGYRKRSGVSGYRVPSTGVYLEGSGGGDAGMKIWRPAMSAAMRGKPDRAFRQPPSSILRGRQVRVPSLYGLSISAATRKLEREGFTVERSYVYSNAPRYSFLGWSPGPGAYVAQYGTVYALYSRGRDPAVVKAEREAARARARAEARAREQARAEARKKAEEEKKKAEEKKKKENGG